MFFCVSIGVLDKDTSIEQSGYPLSSHLITKHKVKVYLSCV